jgi:hypothetical protein
VKRPLNPFYMGDYDGMASDFTNTNTGFVGVFQVITSRGDPNVKAGKLPVPRQRKWDSLRPEVKLHV